MHLKASFTPPFYPKTKSVINYFFTIKCWSKLLLKTITEEYLPLCPENLFQCLTHLTIYKL